MPKQALLDAVVEGHLRHRSVAPRSHPRPARSARRRPPEPDLYPDRPSPRLPLHRPVSASSTALRPELASPHLCTHRTVSTHLSAPAAPPALPRAPAAPSHLRTCPRPQWRPLVVAGTAAIAAMIGIAIVFALLGQRPPDPRPDDALHDRAAGRHGHRSAARIGRRLGRRHAHGLRRAPRRPPAAVPPHDRSRRAGDRSTDPTAPPIRSSRPTAQWIGFFAHGSLKKLRVDGGTPVVLCAARAGAGASWGRDGTIVFGGGPGGGLGARVGGGRRARRADGAARGLARGHLRLARCLARRLRGDLHRREPGQQPRRDLRHRARGEQSPLVDSAAFGRYSPTGHLVFERRGRLEAAPFSSRTVGCASAPRPILRGLATSGAAAGGPALCLLAHRIADLRARRIRRDRRTAALARRARTARAGPAAARAARRASTSRRISRSWR